MEWILVVMFVTANNEGITTDINQEILNGFRSETACEQAAESIFSATVQNNTKIKKSKPDTGIAITVTHTCVSNPLTRRSEPAIGDEAPAGCGEAVMAYQADQIPVKRRAMARACHGKEDIDVIMMQR